MSCHRAPLSSHARREVLARVAPRYQQACLAQKHLLLDAFVDLTGYTRKHAIHLLNQTTAGQTTREHQRLPYYGPEVQQALFLAWKAANSICTKRLIPFLPTLVETLERSGHLHLGEVHRNQLLSMSAATADRFLRSQRKPASRGLSTTKAGSLLKQQIPIRTFQQWDEARPGFLEADLVAHCGGQIEGNYLYTLTLTDIATGWTECLPLLFRSPEAVRAAITRARGLFPFPILGIDTDNGKEFINETMVAYCEREQLTFTRGRPEVKNDQCFVEQKNGAVVRHFIGHDRLSGEQAYRQLRELYRALRLYINCFQPSMKLQAKEHDGDHVRRVYDSAKTPLQRLLLSGVLPTSQQQDLREVAQALDPLRLLDHLGDLQQALFCRVGSVPAASPLRFSAARCIAGPLPAWAFEPAEPATEPVSLLPTPSDEVLGGNDFLDWTRTTRDPFEGAWEHILSLVLAHPERSSGDIFQELQRLSPGRYHLSQLGTLQRGVRKIRAHLLHIVEEPWPQEVIQAGSLNSIESEPDQREHEADQPVSSLHSPSASPPKAQAGARPVLRQPIGEEEARGTPLIAILAAEKHTDLPEEEGSQRSQALQESGSQTSSQSFLPVQFTALTIERAIGSYIQEQMGGGRSPKTVEWHQTALRLFQQYLVSERHLFLLREITGKEVRGWLEFLGTRPTTTGTLRLASTIATYARSVRAFCNWLLRRGDLERTPFAKGTIPKGSKRLIQLIEPEAFEHLLQACRPSGEIDAPVERATARNRAILWVLRETGIRVSELCGLRLGDVDREQRTLRIRGGSKERRIALGANAQHHLFTYLDQYRPKETGLGRGGAQEDHLFLSERYLPLTPNAITLLCGRLKKRAGMTEKRVSPSLLRDTFAVRYLLDGGETAPLQERLGLEDRATVTRYLRLSQHVREDQKRKQRPADHHA